MSGSQRSCMLCDNDYDEKGKKPLLLPCGHSFCKECFHHLSSAMNHLCPVCRMDWSEWPVNSLPVCYQLLPEQGANDPYLCLKHKTHMTIWCSSCKLRICLDCCWQDHLKCSWKPVKKAVADLLDDIGPTTDKVQERLSLWESHAEKLSRFSLQLIGAIAENLSDLRLLEDVAKMMEFYFRNIDHIREQIKRSQYNLQSLGLDYSEVDVLDQLAMLEEKITILNHLGKEPEWPKVPRNSFLRIMDSFQVLKEAFDQLSITSNEFTETGPVGDLKTPEKIPESAGLVLEGAFTNVREEATTSAGADLGGEEESSVAKSLSMQSGSTGEEESPVRSGAEEEAEVLMTNNSTNEEAAAIPLDHASETDSSIRFNISPVAEVARTLNVPVESYAFAGAFEMSDDDVHADLSSSSLTVSQTSSTLISSLASSLRSYSHVDSHDPDLYFFKGILPDVKKLSNSNKMLFKHRVLVRLNALLSGNPSN